MTIERSELPERGTGEEGEWATVDCWERLVEEESSCVPEGESSCVRVQLGWKFEMVEASLRGDPEFSTK